MKNARKKDNPVKLPNLSPSKNQGKKTRNTKLNNLNIEESPEKENIPNKTSPNFRPQTSLKLILIIKQHKISELKQQKIEILEILF